MEMLTHLSRLIGQWNGHGKGIYPTIRSFEYVEQLTVVQDEARPLLHYEQRAWRLDATQGEIPSHWEVGFLRVLEDGKIEIANAQSSGRVEVLRGILAAHDAGFTLSFASILLANDTRMVATARRWYVTGESLRYEMDMHTDRVSPLTLHLTATLRRQIK